MATLTGNKVKDSYQSLLKISTGGSTSTLKTVEDGLGVATGLKLSTNTVEVNSLKITETPIVSSSEQTVLVYDDATKEVKSRELNSTAFSGNGTMEENFIGYTALDQTVETASNQVVAWNAPNNTTENSSYHFGNSPAKLQLDPTNGEYIENISVDAQVIYVDMSSAVIGNSANRDITFTLARWNGTIWESINSFRYETLSSVPEGVSFWGMTILQPGNRLRVDISSVAGGVTLKAGSLFEFIVKETGNII